MSQALEPGTMTALSASRTHATQWRVAVAARLDFSLYLALGLIGMSLAWLIPGRFLPWPAFRQEVIAAAGFALLATAALQKCKRVAWPRMSFLILGVAAVPIIQWGFGLILFRGDAIVCSLYLAAFALSVCVGATLAHSELRQQLLDGLTMSLVFVALLSAGMAFNQWLGPSVLDGIVEPMQPRGRPYANLGQANHLATQLVLGVAAAWYWYEKRRISAWCAALAISWMAWGVVLTEARTAWLAAAIVVLWWLLMRRRVSLRSSPVAITMGSVAFVIGVCIAPTLQGAWSGPPELDGAPPQLRLAAGTRGGHWQTLWDALLRSPWFGYGWNQVSNAQFVAAGDHPAIREWATFSHNLMLDLLIYNGLPLGLLLCAALVGWFARRVVGCRSVESWWLLLTLFVLFLHALLEYPLYYSYYLLPSGLLMGIVRPSTVEPMRAVRAPRLTLALPALGLALLAGAIGLEYLKAEEALRDLELTARRIGPAASELPRADWFFVDGWAAYHRAVTVRVDAGMPANEIENLRKVARRYPYPNVLERYALAAALNGQSDAARHVLLHSCKVHTVPICEGMQRRWNTLQSEYPALQPLAFPALTK